MKNMWKGWLIEESLSDKDILSKVRITNTIIEENIEADEKRIWTLHTVEVKDSEIGKISKILEKTIKPEWYTHFTDMKSLVIIFSGKSFRMSVESAGKDKETGISEFRIKPSEKKTWESALAYGTGKGKVDPRYIIKVE